MPNEGDPASSDAQPSVDTDAGSKKAISFDENKNEEIRFNSTSSPSALKQGTSNPTSEEDPVTQDQVLTAQEVHDRALIDDFINSHVSMSDPALEAIQRLEFVSKPRAIGIAVQLRMDQLPSTHVETSGDTSAIDSSLSSNDQGTNNQSKKSFEAKPTYAELPPKEQESQKSYKAEATIAQLPPKEPEPFITGGQSPTRSQYDPLVPHDSAAEAP